MATGTAVLPASSLATCSGVINMVRQAVMAIGVAIFVAIVRKAATPAAHLSAFEAGWWTIAAITALGFLPVFIFIRRRKG